MDIYSGTDAEYTIEEEDKYYLGVINSSPRSIIMNMTVNVTSKIYDLTNARNMCSIQSGLCLLKLSQDTKYLVLTMPNNVMSLKPVSCFMPQSLGALFVQNLS